MKTADFIREHHYCRKCAEWALSISDDMADVWDAIQKAKEERQCHKVICHLPRNLF